MPTVNCTPGGASDNSYISEADADAYFADTFREQPWAQFGSSRRQVALIQATGEIERQGGAMLSAQSPARGLFRGTPYRTTQALHFPTTSDLDADSAIVVPADIRSAVCEQAYWLAHKDASGGELVDRASLQAQGVRSFSVDGLSEQFGPSDVPLGIAPEAWQYLRRCMKPAGAPTRVR